MTIRAGTRLGPYEIVAPIGAGGMGEVYKARDTRLDRSVAVKILPEAFAQNTQLKIRFEREAKTISQLSHPNICTLYDVGENYLVMELLDGETLADRLTRGPLALADVFRFAVQIAEALGKAHREGVIHRDLKPGNIMITKSGAKLLDFGLAKGTASSAPVDGATIQKPLTQEGAILGTVQYMSPEQLSGEEPDARTDIFAFGAVLYEMITGKRAFEGKTRTSVVSAIIAAEPRPIGDIQPLTPPALDHIVRKCLSKDREERWQSALDVAEELRWVASERPAAERRRGVLPLIALGGLLALAIGVIIGAWSFARHREPAPLIYSEITPPEGTAFAFDAANATLSPDGRSILFVSRTPDGTQQIWLRRLDSPAPTLLHGTENGSFPFWAPDSKRFAFFADGKLRTMPVDSGAAETIADASTPRGGAWSPNGTILFTPTPASTIFAVPATGGEPREVTRFNVQYGDTSHRFPAFLPDGRHFLYFVQGASDANVRVGSIDSTDTVVVTVAQSAAVFAPPDYVLFMHEGVLRAQHIDLKTFHLVGDSTPIAEHVQVNGSINLANVSVSTNGLLAFVNGKSATLAALTYVDKSGKELGTVGSANEQVDVAIAPDGHAAATARYDSTGTCDVWVYDLRRDVQTRQTFSPANEFGATWSPDSKSIVFTSFDRHPGDLFVKRVDSSGPGDPLVTDNRRKVPSCWSADGNYIIFHVLNPGRSWDIEAYSFRDRKVIPLIETPATEMGGQLSPDSKWLAYTSSESGRSEVFVRPFLGGGQQHWQISGGGGAMPRWSRDGKQLFFTTQDGKIMAATVHTAPTFSADAPQLLFQSRMRLISGVTRTQYDVTAGGKFLINNSIADANAQMQITLLQNWTAKLNAQ